MVQRQQCRLWRELKPSSSLRKWLQLLKDRKESKKRRKKETVDLLLSSLAEYRRYTVEYSEYAQSVDLLPTSCKKKKKMKKEKLRSQCKGQVTAQLELGKVKEKAKFIHF